MVASHPTASVSSARTFTELLLDQIAVSNGVEAFRYDENRAAFTARLKKSNCLGAAQEVLFEYVRVKGNSAAHGRTDFSEAAAADVLSIIQFLLEWHLGFTSVTQMQNVKIGKTARTKTELRMPIGKPDKHDITQPKPAISQTAPSRTESSAKKQLKAADVSTPVSNAHSRELTTTRPTEKTSPTKDAHTVVTSKPKKGYGCRKTQIFSIQQTFTHGRIKSVVVEKRKPRPKRIP